MNRDLMSLPMRELLKKFAGGYHKPGSGSAAALLGLISASLSKTVIALTRDRDAYKDVRFELDQIYEEIESKIEPLLEEAFDQDSSQFGKVIEARKNRDRANNHSEWWQRFHMALTELDVASQIALKIAKASIRLTELSMTVFDKGFKSARGDSEIAIEAAISGATGAMSVVYLNLKDFRGEVYAKKILDEASELERKAESLQVELRKRMESLKTRAIAQNSSLSLNARKLLLRKQKKSRYSRLELSEIARNLHRELWLNRNEIWTRAEPILPIHVIDPATTFQLHGYEFEEVTTLGFDMVEGENVEIAGYVDNEQRIAKISRKYSPEARRFTAAHELGHALLHDGPTLFRDRSLDGGPTGALRPLIEIEADSFATFFLMPEIQVREIFTMIFGGDEFIVDRNSSFALGFQRLSLLTDRLQSLRQLSTYLASVDMYAGKPTRSLVAIFGVSPMAMAIRIEELALIRAYP